MAGEDGTPPPPPTKIEPNSPFFLGLQDRPGDFITPVRLLTDNSDAWAHAFRVSLSSRRKFGFLDGSIQSFAPPVTRDDLIAIQCMLVSWIMNTIDPEVKSLLSNYDNAKLLWDDLNERFSVVNGPRIQQLKDDINRCEQTKLMPVATYFGKLKVLWDELANHEPILCCKYYAPIRSTLLSQDPFPSLNRAFQQVVQEERVRGIAKLKDEKPEAVGFAVRTDVRGRARINKSSLACTHCYKTGHDVTTCFEVHGHPEWWLEKFGKSDDKGVAGRGKPSAPSSTSSAGRGRGGARANATKADSAHGNPGAQMGSGQLAAPPTGGAALPGFTTEQWQFLLAVFGTPQPHSNRLNGKTQSTSWIIDTGCSNHVTGDASCLIDIKEVIACPVGLPNGETVVATQAGIAHLTERICLKHVLLDLHSRKLIGAAAHLINRTLSLVLHNKTPYEQLFGSPPLYNEIRVFGSLCFAHNQRAKGDKFASRSRKCVFVGYPFGKKGWYLFDLDTKKFFVSRDVKFYEDIFPFVGTNIAPHKFETWVPMHGGEDVDFVTYPDEVGETHDAGPSSSPT
ncbi:hypothetical protein MRB53_019539 [Persea americana]|uniref:Uncharacterized protein n=1 Tax=Persea americana TaxID=3435 RepID=A0ACC2KYC7_PERAE|nr:hypothetical protein MRB53_019539 [Persea americana]